MKVTQLYIHPIKSLQGIEVSEASVFVKGFQYDRRWMLVDKDHVAITQRSHPHLSQIKISVRKEFIVASHELSADVEIPLILKEGQEIEVMVWDDQVKGLQAPDHINAWFSEVVGESSKLVYMPEDASRPVNPVRAINGEHVSFADAYPYLIIGQSSLDDLNERMEAKLPMNRFRPNIVFEGGEPYEEDGWSDIQIGEVKFRVSHPCKRCVFTTVDQETGKKGAEPLKTLATYRREGKEVIFGMNTLALEEGQIKVGDEILVSS